MDRKLVLATSKIFDYLDVRFDRVIMLNFDFLIGGKEYDYDEEIISILAFLKSMAKKELIIVSKFEENKFFKIKTQNNLKEFYSKVLEKRKEYRLSPYYKNINIISLNNNPFKLKKEQEKYNLQLLKINKLIWSDFSENIYNSKTRIWQSSGLIKINNYENSEVNNNLKHLLYNLPGRWRYKVN